MIRQLIKAYKNNKSGLSLIELMCVLALLSIVVSAVVGFLEMSQSSYNLTEAQSTVQQEVSLMLMTLNKDIRGAERANSLSTSIVITSNGQGLDIYDYDSDLSMYKTIKYRLKPDDKTKLQRGYVLGPTGMPTEAEPDYGTVVDDPADYKTGANGKWKTVLEGVVYKDSANVDLVLFSDTTPSPIPTPNATPIAYERRQVSVNISARDKKGLLTVPISINTTYTSRKRSVE